MGAAFLAFSVAQVIGALRVAAGGQTPPPVTYWVACALLVIAYAVGGAYVLRAGGWSRGIAAMLAAGALFAFPFGTFLGLYGLWVAITWPSRSRPRPPEGGVR